MLNDKQKSAVDYYIKYKNKYEALINAGYSEGYASKYDAFFEKEDIKEYIKSNEKSSPDPTLEIIDYLTRVMQGAEADASATQRIKAAEMLSKHYGLDKEKTKENATVPVVIVDDINNKK